MLMLRVERGGREGGKEGKRDRGKVLVEGRREGAGGGKEEVRGDERAG